MRAGLVAMVLVMFGPGLAIFSLLSLLNEQGRETYGESSLIAGVIIGTLVSALMAYLYYRRKKLRDKDSSAP